MKYVLHRLFITVYLKLYTTELSSLRKLFQIVKKKCAKEIRCFALELPPCNDATQRQFKENIELIANQINNLKILFLRRPPFIGFLEHLEKLETLFIIKRFTEQFHSNEWTNIVHQNLKTLILVDLDAVYRPTIDLTELNLKQSVSIIIRQFVIF